MSGEDCIIEYNIDENAKGVIFYDERRIIYINQRKIGASITDTSNALDFDEATEFGKGIDVLALRDYMITVGKNTRCI